MEQDPACSFRQFQLLHARHFLERIRTLAVFAKNEVFSGMPCIEDDDSNAAIRIVEVPQELQGTIADYEDDPRQNTIAGT